MQLKFNQCDHATACSKLTVVFGEVSRNFPGTDVDMVSVFIGSFLYVKYICTTMVHTKKSRLQLGEFFGKQGNYDLVVNKYWRTTVLGHSVLEWFFFHFRVIQHSGLY